jgi:hypothetical protein
VPKYFLSLILTFYYLILATDILNNSMLFLDYQNINSPFSFIGKPLFLSKLPTEDAAKTGRIDSHIKDNCHHRW